MRQIELLKLGENVLKKENIQDSHIKASTLLQYVLKQTKQELIINSEEIVEQSKVNKYNNYLQKIIKGTPIQYITKHQQFMALDFYVDENALSVNVNRLRKKLESIGIVDFIQTKKGLGYKI